jgi:hypothetical protein
MTFKCTINGEKGDSTVWQGTAFTECDNNHEITLQHNMFEGATTMCNNGVITGRSVNVTTGGNDSHHYTSQLDVIVRPGMIGKGIECLHDNGTSASLVGSTNLTVNTSIICIHTTSTMGAVEGMS